MRCSWAWLLLGSWALACGGGDGSDLDRGTAPQIWCRGLCAAQRECASVSSACEVDCVSRRPGLANISEDGARALRPCVAELSCRAVLGDEARWDSELDACWEHAMAVVDVSGHARAFCTRSTELWFECGAWGSVSECERGCSMWSDAVISRFDPCLEAPSCDAMRTCFETTWSTL